MQRREQYLLAGLLGFVVLWQGGGWLMSALFDPFETRGAELSRLQKAVTEKEDKMLLLARANKSLREWQAISLPPDDTAKSKQPSVLNAQRLYMQWLTDLSQICGFEGLKVSTGGGEARKGNIYLPVVVKVEAEARYEQLVRFLDLFYRTDLLHRVTSLHVSTKGVSEGDPPLTISLDAEGLALLDCPPRRTLFSHTKLAAQLSDHGTTLQVTDPDEFSKLKDFRIQIKNEFLDVTAVNGADWTVQRGVERTLPGAYPEGTSVELVRLKSGQSEQTLEDFRKLIATNIFVKPAPPYKMKLAPLGEKSFVRGKTTDFTIAALSYDTLLGKPDFFLVGSPPAGFKLDRSGKVTWKPGDDIPAGKYEINIEVRHPSAPQGSLAETIAVRVREPKAPPKLGSTKPPKVFLNREWKYRPELVLSDASPTGFTWKLGDRAPQGISINSQTGELSWIPGDAIPIGELTIPLVVTDSDTLLPQATNLSLKVDVQDDAAQFTRLTGIFAVGDNKRVMLTDQSTDRKTELHEGDAFAISDLSGKIKQIGRKYVIMTLGQRDVRWDVGQSLREAQSNVTDN